MSSIYDTHSAAFANVSAYIVAKDGKRVATIAMKFPHAGASRLFAYVQWMGVEMVRGYASGGGYDKRSAACSAAADRLPAALDADSYADGTPHHTESERALYLAFRNAIRQDNGYGWDRLLQDAGFEVWQAV